MKYVTKMIETDLTILIFVIFSTIILSVPRFAHHTPDSRFYLELSDFFQGKTEPQFLRTPYAYRVLLPFLAAQGPTDNLPFNFGIINLFFTIAAYLLFYFYLKSLFRGVVQN